MSNGIADELREFKGHINAGLTPEMVLALRAEVNGIADRIEEQFDRICQQQEAVLQETIEQLRRQMDQQRAMLTEQRDEARAKVIALCNECDEWKRGTELDADRLDEMKRQCDELVRQISEQNELLDNVLGKNRNLRRHIDTMQGGSKKWREKCEAMTAERDELQAKLDEIAGVLDG